MLPLDLDVEEAPISPTLKKGKEDMLPYDLQKELEEKFDELFGDFEG